VISENAYADSCFRIINMFCLLRLDDNFSVDYMRSVLSFVREMLEVRKIFSNFSSRLTWLLLSKLQLSFFFLKIKKI
jgi:hypothetical protein